MNRQILLVEPNYKGEKAQALYDCLRDNLLLEEHTATKKALLDTYEEVRPYFEGFYSTKTGWKYRCVYS